MGKKTREICRVLCISWVLLATVLRNIRWFPVYQTDLYRKKSVLLFYFFTSL